MLEAAALALCFAVAHGGFGTWLDNDVPERGWPVLQRIRGQAPPLGGDVPSPSNPPAGCAFHTRCPRVMDRCQHEMPPEVLRDGEKVRCFLAEDEAL